AEELKGFSRVTLQPGETKTVTMPLKAQALTYWNEASNQFVVEPDKMQIKISSSSDDIKLEKMVSVTE
ncbi:MAG TPA: fibronectin type III-like domain-contianing protein, partial [Alloacidobacterium sp.]|nr:fibronectin type III-like domain-contianing protein [Alloacidobacterium sp.]